MNPSIDRIRLLLKKYYDGTSSIAEEGELARLLKSTEELPDDLLPDKKLFEALAEAANVEVPRSLSDAIMKNVDAKIRKASRHRRGLKPAAIIASLAAAAAIVAIIFPKMETENLAYNPAEKLSETEIIDTSADEQQTADVTTNSETSHHSAKSVSPRQNRKPIYAAASVSPTAVEEAEPTSEQMEAMRFALATLQKTGERLQAVDQTIREAGDASRAGLDRAAESISEIIK